MNGLNVCVTALSDPAGLKTQVDILDFGHLVLDIMVHRVVISGDAIFDLVQLELGRKLSNEAYEWSRALLN